MSNCDPTLEQFIKSVPSCQSEKTLETIIPCFGSNNSDFLVVVNAGHFPLGILSAGTALQGITDPMVGKSSVMPLLSPVTTVSEKISLQQLLPYLEKVSTKEKILVVDRKGKLRGQLDTESILQVLLREQKQQEKEVPSNLQLLINFLEKLPLPLMLQTKQGKLLHQNAKWRENICSHTENCCLVTGDASGGEKQWCNVISQSPLVTSQKVRESNAPCPLFPLSTHPQEATTSKNSGVWQFLTLNLPDHELSSLCLVTATDITEQRQLCKELAAKNADLVQLNRLKDEFLACITHELKSPLTAIVGLSNLLGEKSIGDLNQRQQRYVNQIHQSGRQLMSLVNDLLDLARLETGQLQIHPEVVKLQQVCDRAYEEAYQQTPDSPAEFTLQIEEGLETIIADELRLRQMLVHLLANGRKFTAEQGEMGLEVSQWEGWIAFTVWDTGIGIPESSQHLIFQKFQQLEDPMTRQFSGTGLGLVLTQRLAHAHGGDVSFISEEGKGSQFTLLLPPTPPPKPLPSQASSQKVAGKLVLVVEAVPQYLTNISEQLQKLGYRVAIARSGTEALLKARTFQPCTILLNPVLPLLSGWDVLTLLKSHPSSCNLPIIVTGTRGEKQQAMNNGADAFLSLPVELESLEDALSICAAPRSLYRKSLTVLRLHYSGTTAPPKRDPVTEILSTPPQTHPKNINYRILEADDPQQGELLQRIWHPDVLLLTGDQIPRHFIQELSEQETLCNLPIVCLDGETARLAHQIGKLSVYPCLTLNSPESKNPLWSVLQFAAGINPPPRHVAPYVVVVDGKRLTATASPNVSSEWLNAFIQYLSTAGYRSCLTHSWEDVYQQVEQQGADILLLDLEGTEVDTEILQGLKQLSTIKNLPILAIASPQQLLQHETLHHLLQHVADKILPGHPQSMQELLSNLREEL
ncbi:MAG: ATP-binding protein [Halothece sp. Uz-M2-17]|nr:ATP-binding protein [Halothece sp. Uz-M2-17]